MLDPYTEYGRKLRFCNIQFLPQSIHEKALLRMMKIPSRRLPGGIMVFPRILRDVYAHA